MTVFAVDKLNEGWDVHNLFDIVRLYNTRDPDKSGKVGKTTMSEAHLSEEVQGIVLLNSKMTKIYIERLMMT